MSKQAAEAIRQMIRDGHYTGWTGHTYGCNFMCNALKNYMPAGWNRAVEFIMIELNFNFTLAAKFNKEKHKSCSIGADIKDDYWRQRALDWFEDCAKKLELLGETT